jgi:hypothetical protein
MLRLVPFRDGILMRGALRPNLYMSRPPQIMRRFVADVNPVTKPKSILDYLSSTEHCVFSKDVKPWQKFVCGTIGITAGIAGMVSVCGGVMIVSSGIGSAFTYVTEALDQKKLSTPVTSNQAPVTAHNVLDDFSEWMCGMYNSIPQTVADTSVITFSLAVDGIAVYIGYTGIKEKYTNTVKYFKDIGKMTNCCDIIRRSVKSSYGVFAFAGFAFMMVFPTVITYHIVSERITNVCQRLSEKDG